MLRVAFVLPINSSILSSTARTSSQRIHEHLGGQLLALAGGFTRSFCTGFWVDPDTNRVVSEDNYQYVVAAEKWKVESITAAAIAAARALNQKVLYIEQGSNAKLITLREGEPTDAATHSH